MPDQDHSYLLASFLSQHICYSHLNQMHKRSEINCTEDVSDGQVHKLVLEYYEKSEHELIELDRHLSGKVLIGGTEYVITITNYPRARIIIVTVQ